MQIRYNKYYRINYEYIVFTLGGDQNDIEAPQFYVFNRVHRDNDDEVGKEIDKKYTTVFNRGEYLQAFFEVDG